MGFRAGPGSGTTIHYRARLAGRLELRRAATVRERRSDNRSLTVAARIPTSWNRMDATLPPVNRRRILAVVCLASAGWGFSFGLGLQLGSLWLHDAGCSAAAVGLSTSVYYLGVAVASPFLPFLMRRMGRGAVVAGMVVDAITTALFPWGGGIFVWNLLRLLSGVATALCLVPMETRVNRNADPASRRRLRHLRVQYRPGYRPGAGPRPAALRDGAALRLRARRRCGPGDGRARHHRAAAGGDGGRGYRQGRTVPAVRRPVRPRHRLDAGVPRRLHVDLLHVVPARPRLHARRCQRPRRDDVPRRRIVPDPRGGARGPGRPGAHTPGLSRHGAGGAHRPSLVYRACRAGRLALCRRGRLCRALPAGPGFAGRARPEVGPGESERMVSGVQLRGQLAGAVAHGCA